MIEEVGYILWSAWLLPEKCVLFPAFFLHFYKIMYWVHKAAYKNNDTDPVYVSQIMTILSTPLSPVASHLLSSLTHVHVNGLDWKRTIIILHNLIY